MKSKSSSGLGLAFIIAGLILAFSPETRRIVWNYFLKAVSGLMEGLEEVTGTIQKGLRQNNFRPGEVDNKAADQKGKVVPIEELEHIKQTKS